jgi:hypothetical protein
MRYALCLIVTLAWGLWFGGLMMLFFAVGHLFRVNRPTAVIAAPEIFIVFERYQILLAAVALLTSAIWRLTTPRAALTVLFFLFALASVGTVVETAAIAPRMHAIRRAGESSGPDFRRLHGYSMIVYTAQTAMLLAAGFVLTAARRETAAAAAQALTPPAAPADRALSP